MAVKEWDNGEQVLVPQEPHWFGLELGNQDGNTLVIAPYTADYGKGVPPWTVTLTTTQVGPDGQVLSSAVPIATYQTGFDFQTAGAVLDNGDTGIFWTSAHGTYPASNAVDINMQRIDGQNALLGTSVTLLSDVAGLGQFRVGSLASGGSSFLVTYSSYDATSQTEKVRYAGFTSDGTPIAGQSGVLDTFSSPGYDAFGFGTLSLSTQKASFIYLRAFANGGSPDIGYETVGADGKATSAFQSVPLTYSAGSTNRTLYNWAWTRLDTGTKGGNNLVIAALTGDKAANGRTEYNLEVRVLTAGKTALIDDVIPLNFKVTDLTLTQLGGGNFAVGYTDSVTDVREYNSMGDVLDGGSHWLSSIDPAKFQITESGNGNLLVAYAANNGTALDYDIFDVSKGPTNYRAGHGVVRSNLQLAEDDSLLVEAGGSAVGTVVGRDAGGILVRAGGHTLGSVLNGGFEEVLNGARSYGTILNSAAEEYIVTGAVATGTVVNSGGSQSTSGVTKGTVLNAKSTQSPSRPARDYDAVLNTGSNQWLVGKAFRTQIKGGDQHVDYFGVARSAVLSAGVQDVLYRGIAAGTVIDGGTQRVEGGGEARLTTVNAGGTFDLIGNDFIEEWGTIRGLRVNSGGIAELNGDGQTILGGGGIGIALDGGLLIKQSGAGTSLIRTSITNTGTSTGRVEAASGTLEFGGTLTGALKVTGDAGTSLVFDKAVAAGTTLAFHGSTVAAELRNAATFQGKIAGFGSGDTLDLHSIPDTSSHVPTLTYAGTSSGGILTIANETHSASLRFAGAYTQDSFHLAADGHGGTAITYG